MSPTYSNASHLEMPSASLVEEFVLENCRVTLRRAEGPIATELFFSCQPLETDKSPAEQATSIYAAAQELLALEGGSMDALIAENLFFRDIAKDITAVREARADVIASCSQSSILTAVAEIQQPPLENGVELEVVFQAMLPAGKPFTKKLISATNGCECGECAESTALLIDMGDEQRLMAGALCGNGDNGYDQTHSMFELAEKLLLEVGMEFKDVIRTWLHLREMERDYYPGLNKGRREFFDSRGIDPVPASTGIEGGMVNSKHDLSIGFYAVKSKKPLMRTVMKTPTLNEAGEYGADFTRGMKMTEANKIALHVSGTASIDEAGLTANIDDIGAQIDRMILNLETLLENQGASFADIMYAYNYLKDPADEQLLRDKFAAAGFEGFPMVFVHAEVCRPDLLCETEVFAVLPRTKDDAGAKPNLVETNLV